MADVNVIRNSGGSADIGTAEDGAIMEMFDVGERHLILKKKSIYEFILADQVDPNRINPGLARNIQRLVLDRGSDSELVSRSFLTAKAIFGQEYFGDAVDDKKAMVISLDVLIELSVLDNEINNFISKEHELSEWYTARKNSADYAIPSMIDVKTRCKTIFQKADHISQGIMEIIRLFYPDFPIQHYYSQFLAFIEEKYGKDDGFSKFLQEAIPFLEIIRNARNCLDHRRTEAIIRDFEIQADGNILTPTIEMEYRSSSVPRMSLHEFLTTCNANMLLISEMMIVHIGNKCTKPRGALSYHMREIPKEKRRYPLVNYCFWSNLDFYHQ